MHFVPSTPESTIMTTSHTPNLGGSFELVLIALEENSISAAGVRAIKICNAADVLLAALQRFVDPFEGDGLDQIADDYGLQTSRRVAQGRAAILKATSASRT